MEKIKQLLIKYKKIIVYLIVGFLTTVVNYAVYYCPGIKSLHYIPRNVIAWTAAVIFAFFSNRKWVFGSIANTKKQKLREFLEFILSRLFSLGAETIILWMFSIINVSSDFSKIPASVIVVVLNYITGHFIFKSRKKCRKNLLQ